MEKNIWIRLASSIPIIGNALAILIEHWLMGIAQYGLLLGLLRGFAIGSILCAALIVASEAVVIGFNIIRDWGEVNYTAGARTAIRNAASSDGDRKYIERYQRREKEKEAARPAQQARRPIFTGDDK